MTNSLGAWKNAPLAYVLAEVRTEQIADIKDYQPKLAGKFRDEYPIQRVKHEANLIATGNGVVFQTGQDEAWEFATPDNRTAIILRTNGFVLHATSYIDSKHFFERLKKILGIVAQEVPSVYVNQLGLRYIDFVLPNSGEKPEDYINKRLDPDLEITADPPIAKTSLAVYPMKQGHLSLRYVRGQGRPELPPDLGGFSLEPSALMKADDIESTQPTAIIDSDRVMRYTPVERLNATQIIEHFNDMRNDVKNAFDKAINDHARDVWGATT